jgi:hypothetical protein
MLTLAYIDTVPIYVCRYKSRVHFGHRICLYPRQKVDYSKEIRLNKESAKK